MKRKFTFLMTALLIMFSYAGLAQVVSGTTYSTPNVDNLPTGWSGQDGGGTNYIKLIAAEHYIQTANFEQNGFTSITVKARKYGGPSTTQAQISVSWYDSENEETVLGTIDPTNTTMTDYTLNSLATTTSGAGYIKIQNKYASASKGSGISEVTITYTEPGGTTPTTYTVTYYANVTGTAPVVDNYTEGTDVTLRPANTFTYDGHTFSEWNTQADGDGDPYDAGEVIENIQANIELYAIWTENPVSDEQWVLTNLADLTSTDVFVIVGNNGSNYAMANNDGTTNPPAAVAVTIANNEITSDVAANIQWNISGNANDGYVFYPNGDAESWLYCTNTNNGVRIGTNEANTFNMEASSGYLVHQGTSRYVGIYNSENWRCYTSINANIQNQTFAFYKKVTGGVIPPSITAENVSIEYNATSGTIVYTINNGVDGGTLTAATESDWLTLGTVGATVPFTCTANEAGIERTATVTLTYTYDRATATANVTVTQAGNPNIVNNISGITATNVDYAIIGTIVAKCSRGLVFGDGTGYVYYYNTSYTQDDYNIGDIKKVSGTMGSYNHVFQFTSTANIEAAESSNYNNTPGIQVLDATGIAAYNSGLHLSDYVQIEGTLVKSGNYYNLQVTGLETTASIAYPTTTQAEELNALENKTVRVKGYFAGVSSGHFNVVMESVEEVVNTEPAILLDTYMIEVPAEGGEGVVNVTYQNCATVLECLYVYFCDESGYPLEDESGNSITSCDWITVEFDTNYNVHYVVEPNQDVARMAYFLVNYGCTEVGDLKYNDSGYFQGLPIGVNSDLVTVSQAAAPTFAALPFEFDGGKAAIDTIDGLYQEGLGSDYNGSPKLKFDSTDDYLLLQFDEEPGTLTFDIKGNSFSGGTFTVQTSEDGVTYTDLETYTELSATQHELFDNLGENVRYIKWIYTEKVSGNVALGKIKLLKPATMYSLTVEPFENLEIFTFVGGDESEMALEGAGTIQVAEGNQVMLSVTANDGYEIQSLMVDGVEHVNDIDEAETYTFFMPDHNVTISVAAVAVTPFEPVTYTLVTAENYEPGKTYIIVGSKTINGETYYYAMGEQRTNNRGGVAINVENGMAQVNSAGVHEFIIEGLEDWDPWSMKRNDTTGWEVGMIGGVSIYDTEDLGYLYAASSTANQLRTQDSLDVNGQWEIALGYTGECSFDAILSQNRSVMQFNYNNGNPIFSCYATASQSPVYLYVKDETPSVVTQTMALSAGTNWVSFNVEITLDDLKAALVEASPNTAITIKSHENTTYYNPNNHRWAGSLTWDLAKMYMIKVTEACEITMQGYPVDPAEHPVTIKNGKNWIAFPLRQSMEIADAFAGFAAIGDKIKSRIGITTYNSNGWRGNITNLVPGQGYIYDSNKTEDWTFTFPMSTKATQNSIKHEASRTTIMMSTATKR